MFVVFANVGSFGTLVTEDSELFWGVSDGFYRSTVHVQIEEEGNGRREAGGEGREGKLYLLTEQLAILRLFFALDKTFSGSLKYQRKMREMGWLALISGQFLE